MMCHNSKIKLNNSVALIQYSIMAGISKNCITCSYVGLGSDLICQINIPGLPTLRQKRRPHQETSNEKELDRPKYIFSKNNWTQEKEMALENLLMNFFPRVWQLKDGYVPVGINILPDAMRTSIPNIPSFNDFEKRFQTLNLSTLPEEKQKKLQIIKAKIDKEKAEKEMKMKIQKYFKQEKEDDVVIFFGQEHEYVYRDQKDEPNSLNWKRNIYEKGALIINLTNGYILHIEAMGPTLGSKQYREGCDRLQETMRMFSNQFGPDINPVWQIIRMLYGTTTDPGQQVCQKCTQYIITSKDDFDEKLYKVFAEMTDIRKGVVGEYPIYLWYKILVKDFRYMIKELLPPRVQLPHELIDEITSNLEKAGSAHNIMYWSPQQYDVAFFCKEYHRVIFHSSYSTGKTVLMTHCARKLLESGQKVLFVIFHPGEENTFKSFLQIRLENSFEQFLTSGNVIIKSTKSEQNWEWLKNFHDWNVFIDELILSESPKDGIPTNSSSIAKWDFWIDQDKHLWIVVSGNRNVQIDDEENNEVIDENGLEMFRFEELLFPLRNSREIVEFGQSKESKNTLTKGKNVIVGGRSNPTLTKFHFDVLPDNIVMSKEPVIVEKFKMEEAFKEALANIPREKMALIIFPQYLRLYNPNIDQWFTGLDESNKPKLLRPKKPLIFSKFFSQKKLNEEEMKECEKEVKQWILNPHDRQQDLITDDGAVINGSEFEIVIILKREKDAVDINAAMRCTTLLIVANFKEKNDYSDEFGLHLAAFEGDLVAVRHIYKTSQDIALKDPTGKTPLDWAKEGGHTEVVQFFLQKWDSFIENGDIVGLEVLIEFGIDVKIINSHIHHVVERGQMDVVKLLVKSGADVNVKDDHGRTPLSIAAAKGHLDLVRFLASHGADTNS